MTFEKIKAEKMKVIERKTDKTNFRVNNKIMLIEGGKGQ